MRLSLPLGQASSGFRLDMTFLDTRLSQVTAEVFRGQALAMSVDLYYDELARRRHYTWAALEPIDNWGFEAQRDLAGFVTQIAQQKAQEIRDQRNPSKH